MLQPGWSGALEFWVPSVGCDCDEVGWWHPSGLHCVLGVMGTSEMDHCCEVSFCILDKARRDLFLGQKVRGPGSCHIDVDHRGKGCVFHPISARNPAELWSHSLEGIPPEIQGTALSFVVPRIQNLRCN